MPCSAASARAAPTASSSAARASCPSPAGELELVHRAQPALQVDEADAHPVDAELRTDRRRTLRPRRDQLARPPHPTRGAPGRGTRPRPSSSETRLETVERIRPGAAGDGRAGLRPVGEQPAEDQREVRAADVAVGADAGGHPSRRSTTSWSRRSFA